MAKKSKKEVPQVVETLEPQVVETPKVAETPEPQVAETPKVVETPEPTEVPKIAKKRFEFKSSFIRR